MPAPDHPLPAPPRPSPLHNPLNQKKLGTSSLYFVPVSPFPLVSRLPVIVLYRFDCNFLEPNNSFVVALQHPENSVTPLHDVSDGIGVHCDIETPSKCTGIFHIIGERIMLSFKSTALRFTFSCFKKEHNHTLCCSFYYLQF